MQTSKSRQSSMSWKPTILVAIYMPEELITSLQASYHVEFWDHEGTMPRDNILQIASTNRVVGLICSSGVKIDRELLDSFQGALKVISTVSVGLDHIDLEECRSRGLQLGYTPDVLSDAVAELAIALLLATTRRLVVANRLAMAGRWPPGWGTFYNTAGQIKNSIVGVIGGSGRVGQAIIQRLASFEPSRIFYHSRTRCPELEHRLGCVYSCLSGLLRASDHVVITVSLTPATFHLVGAEQLATMKPTATLVNVSRGAVVDQRALTEALQAGRIRAAGLDVLEKEPIHPDDPLLKMENVVILPHIGSATKQTRHAMVSLGINNLRAGLDGKPLPAPVPV